MSHYLPGVPGADKHIKELVSMVGKNPITESMTEESQEHDKYEVWEAVSVLNHAACEMYCKDGTSFDDTVENLAKAILKLKGKEKQLVSMKEEAESEEEDAAEEGD